jgi:hypothetical protein
MYTSFRKPAAFVALFAITACAGDRDVDRVGDTLDGRLASADSAIGGRTSMVRMINVLPNMDGLTVTADDRSVFSGVNYKDVTQYQSVDETFARFRLQAGSRDTTIATNNEILMDGSYYTVIAIPEADGGVRLRVLKDELTPDEGKARLRVIHAVPNVGEIDVFIQGQTDPLLNNVNHGSEAGFRDVDPGPTTITVRTDEGNRQLVRRQMTLAAGHAYTIVLTSKGGGAVEAITVDDRAPADR